VVKINGVATIDEVLLYGHMFADHCSEGMIVAREIGRIIRVLTLEDTREGEKRGWTSPPWHREHMGVFV
jgi:hypothetical protein